MHCAKPDAPSGVRQVAKGKLNKKKCKCRQATSFALPPPLFFFFLLRTVFHQAIKYPAAILHHRQTSNMLHTFVVSPIHVGVAFAASASSVGKLGSQEISGGKTSRGGIAMNTAPAFQFLCSPSCGLGSIRLGRKNGTKMARYKRSAGMEKGSKFGQLTISCLYGTEPGSDT